jgi:small subunit ribosomal protein S6
VKLSDKKKYKTKLGGFILKKYEAVFILDIRKVDDEGVAFSNELTALIESLGGKMTEAVSMGRKQFTYEINKRKGGIYWDFFFELAPSKVLSIKEKYMLDERILRNMIIVDERPAVIKGEKIQEA